MTRLIACESGLVVPVEPPVLLGFGGVAAVGASGAVELGGPKQRAVLALLMLEPGSVVPLARLIDRMWAGTPPPRAEVSVRGYVSNLRKALVAAGLGPDAITFRDRGYVLHVDPQAVDLHLFDRLVDDALELAGRRELVGAAASSSTRSTCTSARRLERWPRSSVSPR